MSKIDNAFTKFKTTILNQNQPGLKVLQQSTLLLVFVFSPIRTLYPTAAYTQMGSAGSPTAARRKMNRLRVVYEQIYYTSMDERFKIHKELKHLLPHLLETHLLASLLSDALGVTAV